jgi:hypothetical protein
MRRFIFLLVFSTCSPYGYAEPSSVVEYLMDDPVTMLDWGLYRVEERTSSMQFKNLVNSNSFAYYSWNKNRITVGFGVYPSNGSLPANLAEETCEAVTMEVRNRFGTNTKKSFREVVGIAKFFDHAGFEHNDKPAKFMQEIENITNINVAVFASKMDSLDGSPAVRCESPLMGQEIFILKQ